MQDIRVGRMGAGFRALAFGGASLCRAGAGSFCFWIPMCRKKSSRSSGRAGVGGSRQTREPFWRGRNALAMVLLVGAGLLVRSLLR